MVEDTESPRIFHIWSAIFAISSALGRRCWLPSGTFDVYPNHYILLVGTPGTRKTTAANAGKRVLKSSTGVRFAPPDTGGQRQGLIAEMADTGDSSKEYLESVELGARDTGLMSLADFGEITNVAAEDEKSQFVDTADKHHLALVGSEFSRLVGQNNSQMLDFLGEMYDGEDVWYRTKLSKIQLKNCLLNLIACTTPVHINNSLPPAAAGQGFLSRMILVYGAKKYKLVPWPDAPDLELVSRVKDTLSDVYYKLSGPFSMSKAAREHATGLYGYTLDISDSRFGYYNERRFTHLKKLAMCLSAACGRMEIQKEDFEEAHRILRATERGMPDALGEFGLNPLAMLKQEILEQLRANQGPLTMEQIVAMFHRDARSHEITEVINDLIRMGQIKMSQAKSGQRFMSAVFTKANTEDEMMNLLAEG
jgi:energy-coupling factor transporter ATP-binding protein EcfA2